MCVCQLHLLAKLRLSQRPQHLHRLLLLSPMLRQLLLPLRSPRPQDLLLPNLALVLLALRLLLARLVSVDALLAQEIPFGNLFRPRRFGLAERAERRCLLALLLQLALAAAWVGAGDEFFEALLLLLAVELAGVA